MPTGTSLHHNENKQVLKFLYSYPWKFYLKTLFREPNIVSGAMRVTEDRISILSPIEGRLSFTALFKVLEGAPLLNGPSRPGRDTAFYSAALGGRGVNHAFQWVFVVDMPEVQIHQADAQKYSIDRELTPVRVNQLVPSAPKAGMSYWELLNAKLNPIGEEVTPVSILFGIPKTAARNLEDWAAFLGSYVAAIIPLPLVLLEESVSLSPTGIHIVLTTNHTVIAMTQEKEIKLITRVEPFHRLGASRISDTLESFAEVFPEITDSTARITSCDLPVAELAEHAKAFSIASTLTTPDELQSGAETISGASVSPIEALSLYRALRLVPSCV